MTTDRALGRLTALGVKEAFLCHQGRFLIPSLTVRKALRERQVTSLPHTHLFYYSFSALILIRCVSRRFFPMQLLYCISIMESMTTQTSIKFISLMESIHDYSRFQLSHFSCLSAT